ncbi:hypothetical protein EKK58_06495 [Candidatus Dependentiae bacterium]|nr:MAG: hypothetical protein EKK58_06495 [Candidatus Dependentiae bacterium]
MKNCFLLLLSFICLTTHGMENETMRELNYEYVEIITNYYLEVEPEKPGDDVCKLIPHLNFYAKQMDWLQHIVEFSRTCKEAHRRLNSKIAKEIARIGNDWLSRGEIGCNSCILYLYLNNGSFYNDTHHPNKEFYKEYKRCNNIVQQPKVAFLIGTIIQRLFKNNNLNHPLSKGFLNLLRQNATYNPIIKNPAFNSPYSRHLFGHNVPQSLKSCLKKNQKIKGELIKLTLKGLFYEESKNTTILVNVCPNIVDTPDYPKIIRYHKNEKLGITVVRNSTTNNPPHFVHQTNFFSIESTIPLPKKSKYTFLITNNDK